MSLDNAQFPSQLSITDPPFNDPVGQADDQIRTAKRVVFQGFPNISAAMTATHVELNYSIGVTDPIQGQLDDKAPINAPVFTSSIAIGSAVVNEPQLEILDGATISTTELNRLDGIDSNVQDQLDSKLAKDGTKTVTGPTTFQDQTTLATNTSIGPVSSTEIGYLNNVTDPIQTQINDKGDKATSNNVQNGWHIDTDTGVITQWGRTTLTGSGNTKQFNIIFPMTFPSQCRGVQVTAIGGRGAAFVTLPSTSNCTGTVDGLGESVNANEVFFELKGY